MFPELNAPWPFPDLDVHPCQFPDLRQPYAQSQWSEGGHMYLIPNKIQNSIATVVIKSSFFWVFLY